MLKIDRTNRFKKDVRLMTRRGKKMEKLKVIVEQLALKQPLDLRYCDHALSGNFSYA